MLKGIVASEGIGIGKALIIKKIRQEDIKPRSITQDEIDSELLRIETAVRQVNDDLSILMDRASHEISQEAAEVFKAQLMILNDPLFMGEVIEIVKAEMVDAGNGYLRVMKKFIGLFEKMKEDYFRERAQDIREVGERVLSAIHGYQNNFCNRSEEEIVLIGNQIGIGDIMHFDKSKISGICVESFGRTSHMAIFAKTMEIPMIVSLAGITEKITEGKTLILDGVTGEVFCNFTEETLEEYRKIREEFYVNKFQEKISSCRYESKTLDGHRFEIDANIEREEETVLAAEYGAQSIGLYRTEYLFAEFRHLPTENEQYTIYKKVLRTFPDQPVIIRTFDLGGDKQFYRFRDGEEENPFLGLRGIRILLKHTQMFVTQIRALLRASPDGNLHILFPMISSMEEIMQIRKIVSEVQSELKDKKIPVSDDVKIGVLIETPASAYLIDDFSREVDFFSIGTNDLLQFVLAVDRNNPYISDYYNQYHPAIFRSLGKIISRVHRNGLWVSICGEMGANHLIVPVLLGFGIDKISLSPPMIPRIKKLISCVNLSDAQKLAEKIITISSSSEIRTLLEDFQRQSIKVQEVRDEMPALRC